MRRFPQPSRSRTFAPRPTLAKRASVAPVLTFPADHDYRRCCNISVAILRCRQADGIRLGRPKWVVTVATPGGPAIRSRRREQASDAIYSGAGAKHGTEQTRSGTRRSSVPPLEAMAQDFAAIRQNVERLAAGQEQLAHDRVKLQSAVQEIEQNAFAPARNPNAGSERKPQATSPRSRQSTIQPTTSERTS
jgi:hypothetical protein